MGNSNNSSKILRGSFLMMISYLFFRVGGYFYRAVLSRMLEPAGYGLLGLTLPLQGIFQSLSSVGFQPAIAKFVSQHNAVGEEDISRQVIITSLKFMMISGTLLGLIIFFSADWIANYYFHKPAMVYPLQAVALITPFSVIVSIFRGSFQGFFKMEFIVASRVVEQVFMIGIAIILVSVGFYAAGAVLGTGFGFMASAIVSFILFKKYIWVHFPKPTTKMSFKEEMILLKTILTFSIPIAITGLSEMGIYDVGPLVIGRYLPVEDAAYYTTADPIARLPLIISLSVAAVILPAASEAASLKDQKLLGTYITQSYRYVVLLVLPICVGIALFAQPLLSLLFGAKYIYGANALSILVFGMTFYTLFMVSSSIVQGIGHPRLPMFIMILGTGLNIGLNFLLVPLYGIIGAAIATTIVTFIIMAAILWKTVRLTEVGLPYIDFAKIGVTSIIMGLPLLLLPQNYYGLFAAILISPIIYTIVFAVIGGFTKKDVQLLRKYAHKLGPLSNVLEIIVKFIERFAK
ncbi:oligosaccharide flippase family protein [Methanobacterium oryzae]|uniref:oligosaccharide flippase family protein n=1 Tax=Methanobacterium oryzae TaxID=69540 RepID=UPI003D1EBB16